MIKFLILCHAFGKERNLEDEHLHLLSFSSSSFIVHTYIPLMHFHTLPSIELSAGAEPTIYEKFEQTVALKEQRKSGKQAPEPPAPTTVSGGRGEGRERDKKRGV